MIVTSKIVQALCLVLSNVKKADKLKLIKLLFLADKYHVIRYGRTVTGDDYWAMDYGPVGSAAKDILSLDKDFLSREYPYAAKMLKKIDEHTFETGITCKTDDLDYLSETDREAIQFVVTHFGRKSTKYLISLTHQYPEWARFKELFENKIIRREKIETEDLISALGDEDILGMSNDHMKEAREVLTGRVQ